MTAAKRSREDPVPPTRFHVKPEEIWLRAAQWAGHALSPAQVARLHRYRSWLIEEALPAGGIGPNEAERVDSRHIGDSLLFAAPLPPTLSLVLDVGSGAGLPGIPLAILLPDARFHLLDRSERRADLMRRATRVLGLDNVVVEEMALSSWRNEVAAIVSRGTIPPDSAFTVFSRILSPGGVAVVGGSWTTPPEATGLEHLQVPARILDRQVWLLIMRRT